MERTCKHCGQTKLLEEFDSWFDKRWNILRYRYRCTECRKAYDVKYHSENAERKSEYSKGRRDQINQRRQERFNNEPEFKLLEYLRSRVKDAMKTNSKTTYTIDLLGCSIEYYRSFLEYQWTADMDWSNYGKTWTVDHVRPCSSFDMSKEDDQKACFSWTNCRPMTKEENRTKGNKVDDELISQHKIVVEKYIKAHGRPNV